MSEKILAIDTSSDACSVALCCNDRFQLKHALEPRKHAELVLPMVDRLLAEAGVSLNQLDAIAFGCGPGSFTGLRIAAGVVQGLAFGADLPVISVSSLAMLAHQVFRVHHFDACHVALDARMGEVYWGSYRITHIGEVLKIGQECVSLPEHIAVCAGIEAEQGWVGAGSGWKYEEALRQATGDVTACLSDIQPNALDLLHLAKTKWQRNEGIPSEQVMPVYLRNNVAVKPNKRV